MSVSTKEKLFYGGYFAFMGFCMYKLFTTYGESKYMEGAIDTSKSMLPEMERQDELIKKALDKLTDQ